MRKPWGRFEVAERSMAPSLQPGDWLLTLPKRPVRRSVVVFRAPNGMVMVKRVVALPSETVTITGGRFLIDGSPVDESGPIPGDGRWRIGPGSVFVLSDARDLTRADSRTFGPISSDRLLGTVVWRYGPKGRWGSVR